MNILFLFIVIRSKSWSIYIWIGIKLWFFIYEILWNNLMYDNSWWSILVFIIQKQSNYNLILVLIDYKQFQTIQASVAKSAACQLHNLTVVSFSLTRGTFLLRSLQLQLQQIKLCPMHIHFRVCQTYNPNDLLWLVFKPIVTILVVK